jgi:hypothetical protein
MNAEAILLVAGVVVGLTQYVKWAGLASRWAPFAVLLLSGIGVAIWAYSTLDAWDRRLAFSIFAGWASVVFAAAGVYGFVKETASTVMSVTKTVEPEKTQAVRKDYVPQPTIRQLIETTQYPPHYDTGAELAQKEPPLRGAPS